MCTFALNIRTNPNDRPVGSTEMYTMHEALAREHTRRREREARQRRLVSELAAANRWHYLERRAHEAHRRHAQRAQRAAQSVAGHPASAE